MTSPPPSPMSKLLRASSLVIEENTGRAARPVLIYAAFALC